LFMCRRKRQSMAWSFSSIALMARSLGSVNIFVINCSSGADMWFDSHSPFLLLLSYVLRI